MRKLFHGYVRTVVNPVGYLPSWSKAGYACLPETIPRFYGPEKLAGILAEAGYGQVTWRPLFFGMAAVHAAIEKRSISGM
jgi:demethylmenaquinone methyltransferase/2-methoxy-6-polyprenyl-1,4-benzoquinol methylase